MGEEETLQHAPKIEDTSGDKDIRSPIDLMQDITDRQQFMDDNLSDVMRNLAIASNLSSLLNITTTAAPREATVTATANWKT